ncbi:MAG: FtsX-like permease family protein [Candidatus Limiplasma sp.]|nr:FtsX-like permease family protein [Candidatus Limiplasma sp.]
MPKLLYLRLAWGNLWKNRGSYFPFLLACLLLTFTVYSFSSMALNRGLAQMPGAMVFPFMLALGLVIVCLFAAIFLFYANSFLIKRRKKELGLYAVLGMEKRHIARVLRREMDLCYLAAMGLGLGLGLLLSRLLYLLVGLLLRVSVPLEAGPNSYALIGTAVVFAVLFFLLKLYNSHQVRSVNPLALLQGSQVGEKEPASRWPLAVVGVAAMAAGYVLAQWVKDPLSAIALFFIAVVLVIIGTYCLFMAGSLTVLKLLKNNRRFFYQPRHFITVSGMLYRMKQNAAGLASIAILCTMAMVTVGTTVALYNGSERSLNQLYPHDLAYYASSPQELERLQEAAQAAAVEESMPLTEVQAFESRQSVFWVEDGRMTVGTDFSQMGLNALAHVQEAYLITQDTFSALQGEPLALPQGAVGWWAGQTQAPALLGEKGAPSPFVPLPSPTFQVSMNTSYMEAPACLVFPDEAALEGFLAGLGLERADFPSKTYTLQMNLAGDLQQQEKYLDAVQSRLDKDQKVRFSHRESMRLSILTLYGGFLFVGVFLGLLFMMATALIIYFKQISEGYQDHDRFLILQQVGMSAREVKATVRTQILLVFFLPLVVALLHVLGSLHMIILMLKALSLADAPYIALNAFLAAVGIAALYTAVYLRTAKTYYKMVRF